MWVAKALKFYARRMCASDFADERLRVLTLNLHCWQETDAEAKLAHVAAEIALRKPHVVCLQEVGQHVAAPIVGEHHGATIRADNAALVIVDTLERVHGVQLEWAWTFAHIGFDVWEEGVAVLTTGRIDAISTPFVSQAASPHTWNARRLLIADIDLDALGNVAAASAHFSWWTDPDEPFAPQWDRTEALLEGHHTPAIIAGDFNVLAGSDGYAYALRSGRWEDAHLEACAPADPQGTFPGDIAGWKGASSGRIDYVFTRGNEIQAIEAELLFTSEATRVSDHFGLLVEFNVIAT